MLLWSEAILNEVFLLLYLQWVLLSSILQCVPKIPIPGNLFQSLMVKELDPRDIICLETYVYYLIWWSYSSVTIRISLKKLKAEFSPRCNFLLILTKTGAETKPNGIFLNWNNPGGVWKEFVYLHCELESANSLSTNQFL